MNPACVLQHLIATEQRLPAEWVLWDAIRDDVEAYFDESLSPWSIDDEVLGAQGLAINFFFPLREDLDGLSRLLGLLCGRQLSVDACDLICRGRAAPNAPPFDLVAHVHDLDASSMLLLLKCMPPIGGQSTGPAAGQWRSDVRLLESAGGSPAAEGGLAALKRAQRLADDLEAQGIVDRAVFAVVHDNRDLSLAEVCGFWHGLRDVDGRFQAWTYQQMLALAGSMLPDMPGWRSFLRDRYGIAAIGAHKSPAEDTGALVRERRSA